jgi:hypothetical protein
VKAQAYRTFAAATAAGVRPAAAYALEVADVATYTDGGYSGAAGLREARSDEGLRPFALSNSRLYGKST